ncbi:MAG TPA: FAD-dependent oxidoreductase [Urbifossiella sp.]|jgi:thioredoxin reductase
MPKLESLRIAILGAGPMGIEAALYAKACGCAATVYERGQVGEHLLRWGHVKMFTPFGLNVSPLGMQALLREKRSKDIPAEGDLLTGRQFREAYLVPLSESETLIESMHPQNMVIQIGRANGAKKSEPEHRLPFRLLVRSAGGERIDTADVVLDCTGAYASPNWLGDGGLPAVGEIAARQQIPHGLEDILGERKEFYAGKSIVLVGGGYSAATAICQLATVAEEHPSTWVFWLTRGPRGAPLPRIANDPFKERDKLAVKANSLATRCDGNLEFHPQTSIDEVIGHGPDKGFRVAGRSNGKPVSWDVDRVIGATGYRADLRLSGCLRVEEPAGRIETREPGYYILGSKSFGRDSGFLLRDGIAQVRAVFAEIAGNPRLDLYGKKAA